MRKNKPELPVCMITHKGSAEGDSKFLFSGPITLVSNKSKKTNVVCIISTMHQDKSLSQSTKKPHTVEHYNQTKEEIDSFNQMSSVMSCT